MKKRTPLGGYLIGRSAALAVLMVLAALSMLSGSPRLGAALTGFFFFTALSYAFTLITALVALKRPANALLIEVQPVWEVFYSTSLIYLTGGIHSPFVFIYLLSIIGAATLTARRGALRSAHVASAAYLVFSLLQFGGSINPYNPFYLTPGTSGDMATRLFFHIAAFYAVAFLAGYLADELRRTGERLAKAHGKIQDLTHLQAAILQSMGSGLIVVDDSGEVMFHNEAAHVLLGKAGVGVERYGEVFDLSRSDRHEAKVQGETEMVFGYTVFPLSSREGSRIGKILTFQDLTRIRKLEEGLARSDRMAAIGRLAAGLAHEIRNPLASISGSVQVLYASGPEASGEQEQLFQIVLKETDRLNHLVSDFLGYARPGELRIDEFDLVSLVKEVDFFFRQGEGKGKFELTLEAPDELIVEADRERFESVLLNLFRNSIEASPDGVRELIALKRYDGWISIEVADDGPGMSPDIVERAFEPFVSSKPGGTGLGLATIHRIIQSHGGTVGFWNREEGGAVFSIRIPAKKNALN